MKKQERIDIVNQIIKEIGSHGRRFFYNNGSYAEIFIKNNKFYYKCEWVSEKSSKPITEICLSVPDYRSYKGWYHGGTLRSLVKDFLAFIKTGEHANGNNGYGGLYCDNWGYKPEDMLIVQSKAIELGYLTPYAKSLED